MIRKIISGGQTGADQGGLRAARYKGIETGGTAPLGYRTEKGAQRELLSGLGLKESRSSSYPPRTAQNVKDSDGTVVFGNSTTPGSRLTINLCRDFNKPFFLLPDIDNLWDHIGTFRNWLESRRIGTLNVAGNRESKKPGIEDKVRDFLEEVLSNREVKQREELSEVLPELDMWEEQDAH